MLSPNHQASLREGSGISDPVIAARGYRTISDREELLQLGFSHSQARVPGLLLPLWTTDGRNPLAVYRPDNPRAVGAGRKRSTRAGQTSEVSKTSEVSVQRPSKVIKYEFPKGAAMRVDCPPPCRARLGDPATPLWITEGQKKADALASRGLCALALLGVWNWKGRNAFGGTTVLADFDYVAWEGRQVYVAFDSDVTIKPSVRLALERLVAHLQRRKARVSVVYLPGGPNGKLGVDDYLAAGHTPADLEALAEKPRPAPQDAPPTVEVLEDVPDAIRRPLALVRGQGYAAAWLPVRVTQTEIVSRGGEVVRLDPPRQTVERKLFIVRGDGATFGDASAPGVQGLSALGCEVHLPEKPPDDRLWSPAGVLAYREGRQPAPAEVFRRVAEVIDRFIDFDRSLADQGTMSDMVACFVLATWFLDAFSVIGYLWPSGERGSGKTQLLTAAAELAYLGQVVLGGGSFASLRDLAEYGATLAFDDAENLADPDKRAMLLAGNRRGSTVSLKEPFGEGWRTRHVTTFCARLFSAIRLPDPVLASRTIVVPLVRTADRRRANADPLEYGLWPHDRRALLDDLWALGLAHRSQLPDYERRVNERAALLGRSLEPWRAILAVALWLEERGAQGLWARMEALSQSYQGESPDLEAGDLTRLVVAALCQRATRSISTILQEEGAPQRLIPLPTLAGPAPAYYSGPRLPPVFEFATSEISALAQTLGIQTEADFPPERINPRRVGMVLGKLRFKRASRSHDTPRRWIARDRDVVRLAEIHGVTVVEKLKSELEGWEFSPEDGADGADGAGGED